jgi:hypothetical protein
LKPDDPELLVEKPFVMPESWVCLGRLGFREEPIEAGIPEERAGALTFGTMNNPYKYTPELFALWAEVMNRVPGSRFLFVRPEAGAPTFRANIAHEFAKHGVSEERLLFESVRGKNICAIITASTSRSIRRLTPEAPRPAKPYGRPGGRSADPDDCRPQETGRDRHRRGPPSERACRYGQDARAPGTARWPHLEARPKCWRNIPVCA